MKISFFKSDLSYTYMKKLKIYTCNINKLIIIIVNSNKLNSLEDDQ